LFNVENGRRIWHFASVLTAGIVGVVGSIFVWHLMFASENRAFMLEFAGRADNPAGFLSTGHERSSIMLIFGLLLCGGVTSFIWAVRRTNDKFEKQNFLLDAALENMSQGICVFDAMQRLLVCNKRYAAFYGLNEEQTKPGTELRVILNHRIAHGSAPDDHENYITDRINEVAANKPYQITNKLSDGRYVSVVHRPMAGGGWVATHDDVTAEKRAEERIVHVARHDALTGLPNRILFAEQLEQALKRVQRGEQLAVLYIDLDHLKWVNDTLGHPIGDQLLIGVAARLRGCIRDIDTAARLSGDEFAVIQSSIDASADAAALAMRIGEAIRMPFDLDGHQVVVDASIGISIAPNDAIERSELQKNADIALYEAKNSGRGTYCFYEKDMNDRMQVRDKLEQDLRKALANGEFELFYQPVVSLPDNKITAFEALLRWHHPERGIISPAQFIQVAEEMGLIIPLGEWVLRAACAEAATWPNDIKIAVNVSSLQLTNKNLVNVIVSALASARIPANRLEIEITESVFIKNTSANISTLKELYKSGVRIAMDDFGTGYSSLGYLLRFPFSKIKIDRSFITALSDNKDSRAIVRAVADLGRNLSMTVTAEGVETDQQLEQVRILGCTEMQGYLFSQPLPAAEIHRLFLANMKDAELVAGKHDISRLLKNCADAHDRGSPEITFGPIKARGHTPLSIISSQTRSGRRKNYANRN
jgi:diguanylate cyclase (GGDEF)-like protein